jgi:hypothetical protein
VVVARAARNSDTPLRDLARPFLCFAVLLVLLARSAPDGGEAPRPAAPRGWPSGASACPTSSPTRSARPRRGRPRGGADNLLDCSYYVNALRSSFDQDGDFGQDLVGAVAFQPHLRR